MNRSIITDQVNAFFLSENNNVNNNHNAVSLLKNITEPLRLTAKATATGGLKKSLCFGVKNVKRYQKLNYNSI